MAQCKGGEGGITISLLQSAPPSQTESKVVIRTLHITQYSACVCVKERRIEDKYERSQSHAKFSPEIPIHDAEKLHAGM